MRKKWLLVIPVLLLILYLAGPQPATPRYDPSLPEVPSDPDALEKYIMAREIQHHIKPDNQARIIWNDDTLRQKTPFSIIYLHGFSASQAEGDPIHKNIARKFNCNLYLSRLAEHGIDTSDALMNLTPDNYWESAKEALAIGKQLGERVIIMGTSTGGSLALALAANFPEIHSLILLSPNIAINADQAWLLNNPWGLKIARTVLGSNYITAQDDREIYKQYWSWRYRIEAAVQLEEFLETAMTKKTFKKVHQPVLTLYYYKDKINQDSVVKVSAMLEMMDQLSTPKALRRAVAAPNAGHHVLGSYIKSQDLPGVEKEIEKFIREIAMNQPK